MEKVAILARVSTQGQDYERQVLELTDYCQRMNWEVVEVFANKVSGVTRTASSRT
jgi:DNA invertase Pin-like site-specific DNA recombinase